MNMTPMVWIVLNTDGKIVGVFDNPEEIKTAHDEGTFGTDIDLGDLTMEAWQVYGTRLIYS